MVVSLFTPALALGAVLSLQRSIRGEGEAILAAGAFLIAGGKRKG